MQKHTATATQTATILSLTRVLDRVISLRLTKLKRQIQSGRFYCWAVFTAKATPT